MAVPNEGLHQERWIGVQQDLLFEKETKQYKRLEWQNGR